jgi:hypothetical protein
VKSKGLVRDTFIREGGEPSGSQASPSRPSGRNSRKIKMHVKTLEWWQKYIEIRAAEFLFLVTAVHWTDFHEI